jgi:integrase
MNKYLKETAEIIGINQPIHTQEGPTPKSNLIQTHTARRTFATNAYIQGIPINFIMSITGHKTEKEFRKYIKIDDLKSAIQFNKFKNIK